MVVASRTITYFESMDAQRAASVAIHDVIEVRRSGHV